MDGKLRLYETLFSLIKKNIWSHEYIELYINIFITNNWKKRWRKSISSIRFNIIIIIAYD